MAEVLKVDGQVFNPDDLTFGEKREVRRIIRAELWDDTLGDFDWEDVGENEVIPATVAVFMRRTDPAYTLERALALKPSEVYVDEDEAPPTKPRSSARASGRKKTSATSGTRS